MTDAKRETIRVKIAQLLLSRRERNHRRRSIAWYSVWLVLAFSAHGYFSNLATPLKLIPQTLLAYLMGYLVTMIASVFKFPFLAEFIAWEKVSEVAERKQKST